MNTADNKLISDKNLGDKGLERLYTDIILVILFVCSILVILMPFVKIRDGNLIKTDMSYSDSWVYTDGTPATVDNIDFAKEHEISRTISSDEAEGASLCFDASNLFFKVYLNDTLIYSFEPEIYFFYGLYYGDYTHFVTLPNFDGDATIRIEYTPLIETSWSSFRDMKLANAADYFRSTVMDGIGRFTMCFVTAIIGILLVIIGLFFHTKQGSMLETCALGALAFVVSFYQSSGTGFVQVIFRDSAVPRLMEYVTLSFLPITLLLFIAAYTKHLSSIFVKIFSCVSFAIFMGIMGSLLTSAYDFKVLLPIIHANLLISAGFVVFYVIRGARNKKFKSSRYIYLIVAVSVLLLSGFVDLLRFYFEPGDTPTTGVTFGLAFFVLILGVYEILNFLDVHRKSIERDIMSKLAHVDSLTGLSNRLAFDETEREIENSEYTKACFIQMDVNYLKQVNDNYGHAEGDRQIIAAARVISESFGQIGSCFRTGGDEFFIIISGVDCELNYTKGLDSMNKSIETYNKEQNPPVPLHIAYGMSVFETGKTHVADAEKLADKRMYECKKKLKANNI